LGVFRLPLARLPFHAAKLQHAEVYVQVNSLPLKELAAIVPP
jgi:hypothetical protein